MHLSLLEQAIVMHTKARRETSAVLTDRAVIVPQVQTEVQRVVRRDAYPTQTRRECMNEAMPIQKGGMSNTHTVLFSMV